MASKAPPTTLRDRILRLVDAVRRGELRWVGYAGASVLALATDSGLFLALLDGGLSPMAASSIGYVVGILVHWLISSRLVFADGTAARGSDQRRRQKALFVGSALIGLAITTGIVGGGVAAGIDPRIAKLIAIIISFQTTYLLRRHVVFRG